MDPNPHNLFAKRARRLRVIGSVVLLVGLVGAGFLYSTASPDTDISMLGFNRAEQRQMGQLYGKMGLAVDQLLDDFRNPKVDAALLAIASIVVAAVCFYLAQPPDEAPIQ